MVQVIFLNDGEKKYEFTFSIHLLKPTIKCIPISLECSCIFLGCIVNISYDPFNVLYRLLENVFKCPPKNSSCLQEQSNTSWITVLRFYIKREISAHCSCNLHLRESGVFLVCLCSHPIPLKNIRFFVPFLQIPILEILTAGDSDTVPKAMPWVFYLDLRFFVFCWYSNQR